MIGQIAVDGLVQSKHKVIQQSSHKVKCGNSHPPQLLFRSLSVAKEFQGFAAGFLNFDLFDGTWDGVSAATLTQIRTRDKNIRRRWLQYNWDITGDIPSSAEWQIAADSGKPSGTTSQFMTGGVLPAWPFYTVIDNVVGRLITWDYDATTSTNWPNPPMLHSHSSQVLSSENPLSGAVDAAVSALAPYTIGHFRWPTISDPYMDGPSWDGTWAAGFSESNPITTYPMLPATWGDGHFIYSWPGIWGAFNLSGWGVGQSDLAGNELAVDAVKSQFTGLQGPYWIVYGYLGGGGAYYPYAGQFTPIRVVTSGIAHATDKIDIPFPADSDLHTLTDPPLGKPLYNGKGNILVF